MNPMKMNGSAASGIRASGRFSYQDRTNGNDDLSDLIGATTVDEAGETIYLPAGFRGAGALLTMDLPAQRWLVDGIIPAEGDSLLVSKPKVGKSTLGRALAIAIAQGRPILGREATQGRVLYLTFTGEGSDSDIIESFAALGLKQTDALVHRNGPRDAKFDSDLEECLSGFQPALVIVDTIQKMLRVPLNEYDRINAELTPYQELFKHYGTASLFIHHARKGESDDPIELASGSVALTGAMETVIALVKKDERRYIQTVQRNAKRAITTAHEVEMDAAGWPTLGLTRGERARQDVADAVMAHLRRADCASTQSEIFSEVECRREHRSAILRRLEQDGRVNRTGTGRRNDPYRYEAVVCGDEFSDAEIAPETLV
jgi:hypothetical protein